MYRLEAQDLVKGPFMGLWSLLAFQAGFINSIGFLACHRFVSHVTGFGSQVGVSLGQGKYALAAEMLSAPAAFILGAWTNGILTVSRTARGLRPYYDWVTFLIPIILVALFLAGSQGLFGVFGEPLLLHRDFAFLGGLSFVCGMQNACFATLTKGQVRTTHLTGISTDVGTDLALSFHPDIQSSERTMARKRNVLRGLTIVSFATGAVVSALLDNRLEYTALLIPAGTAFFVWGVFLSVKRELDQIYPAQA
jgi:uncharacterized membrane protein YoaK (UPF0700 family)